MGPRHRGGKKYKGLYVYDKGSEWKKHPVIRLDLSGGKYYEKERVHGTINGILRRVEDSWGLLHGNVVGIEGGDGGFRQHIILGVWQGADPSKRIHK